MPAYPGTSPLYHAPLPRCFTPILRPLTPPLYTYTTLPHDASLPDIYSNYLSITPHLSTAIPPPLTPARNPYTTPLTTLYHRISTLTTYLLHLTSLPLYYPPLTPVLHPYTTPPYPGALPLLCVKPYPPPYPGASPLYLLYLTSLTILYLPIYYTSPLSLSSTHLSITPHAPLPRCNYLSITPYFSTAI